MPERLDQMGRRIVLEGVPRRIVSLVPSQTELLFELGQTDALVGVTKFCVHPKDELIGRARVGGTKRVNLEAVAALNPDLIIGNKEENERADIEALARDYPVWMSEISSLTDAVSMIRMVGELCGARPRAQRLATEIETGFAQLAAEPAPVFPRRCAYLIWRNPYMAAGSNTFIDNMLQRMGLVNVFAERPRYPSLTLPELRDLGTERILLSSEPFPFAEKHREEIRTELGDEIAIDFVDGEMFSWPGSRLRLALPYLRELRTRWASS